ncbi:sphingomyelin phosphodiesterase, partial [Vibrio parahaemolyticus]|nr:sphingomyelin phosphodiesterase [Vibrio parahaemolyticus]
VFPDCSGTDCFADKGVNYAEIIKGGQAYHVFATHTASFDTDTAREYRQRQFKQIRALAQSLDIPSSETVVYSGDFNVNKRKFPGDYQQMIANLSAIEPHYSGYTESTFDPRINNFAGEALSGGENVEYLDYVMVSSEYGVKSFNDNRVDVPRTTAESLWKHYNLSDHFPVSATIKP